MILNTTAIAMSARESRAYQIRELLTDVLNKIPEYHTTQAAQNTLQDIEEMMYSLWRETGATHERRRETNA